MGRRHLILSLAVLAAALAAGLVAAGSANTASTLNTMHWSPLVVGSTGPSGSQAPTGKLATSAAQVRGWISRIATDQRRRVSSVDFSRRVVVASFLDGMPCAENLAVSAVTRSDRSLTVHVAFTRPPVGLAACVRTSTAYEVITVARAALGTPLPSRAIVEARARA